MAAFERHHGDYVISTDRARFDVDVFHTYLSEVSYWAKGRARETTELVVGRSVVFGLYAPTGEMVGAARVVTDGATFGWLCDLFVLPAHRGWGLGKALVGAVRAHPALANTKRLLLATADAHGLYRRHGFEPLRDPDRWMEWRGSTP